MSKKLTPPVWAPNAIMTPNGWEDPETGELYVSSKYTQEEVDAFHQEDVKFDEHVEDEVEDEDLLLEKMTKQELFDLLVDHGFEVDSSYKKEDLLFLAQTEFLD